MKKALITGVTGQDGYYLAEIEWLPKAEASAFGSHSIFGLGEEDQILPSIDL